MIKVKIKIKSKGIRFIIPVPYTILHLAVGIVTSKLIRSIINRSISKDDGIEDFQIPDITRHDLKPLLKQLQELKGFVLVDTLLEDGTEVSVKL